MKHNWEYKKLENVCSRLFAGGDVPKDISKEATNEYRYPIYTNGVVKEGLYGYSKRPKIDKPAVTISGRGTIGAVFLRLYPFVPAIRLITAVPSDCNSINYLAYALKSISIKSNGATIQQLTIPMVKGYTIPVPPMEVQEKIVAELDKINEVIADNREMLKKLNALQQSIFYDMFGDPVSNPKGWKTMKLNTLAPANPSSLNPLESNGKVWLLNLDQVESNTGRIISVKFFDKSEVGSSTVKFDVDNILYSKLRPYLNKVVIPQSNGICTSELIPLKPNQKFANRLYIGHALRLPEFVKYINGKTGGAKMPRVKMQYFWNFDFPIPPLALQEKFASKIEAIEAQKASIEETIKKMRRLLDSRMDFWFN